jgi:hypothetical protein
MHSDPTIPCLSQSPSRASDVKQGIGLANPERKRFGDHPRSSIRLRRPRSGSFRAGPRSRCTTAGSQQLYELVHTAQVGEAWPLFTCDIPSTAASSYCVSWMSVPKQKHQFRPAPDDRILSRWTLSGARRRIEHQAQELMSSTVSAMAGSSCGVSAAIVSNVTLRKYSRRMRCSSPRPFEASPLCAS